MFENNIKTEPIPERVYELCKIVSKGDIDDKIVKERMEPKAINSTSSTSYYGSIREVCVQELKLITKEGDVLSFVGDKKILKDMDSFRKYCNSIVFKNKESDFYKIAVCFLDSNDSWLKYSTLSNQMLRREVEEKTQISLVSEQMMLGMRFWMSFLGFGYIQEIEKTYIYFLPNMHIALQDFCEFIQFERNKEYTVSEFISMISNSASVALENTKETMRFNLAMSNALRQMHDRKEIVLKKALDSKETWELYHDETHEFTDKITHIVYRGVNRG
jgi:hypothetical protein